ncbi:MAG: hypothetical protein KDI79_19215, partial [Anaerolineae bacterium]|nr:hypothetical protein [Anaerolineae bacterium]
MIANWSVPRVHYKIWGWLFWVIIGVIVLSPIIFWATGIGQNADNLSAELTRQPDGALLSSPKAQAYHELMLPMRLERMLIYPLLLLSFQFSGGAITLRTFIENQVNAGRLTPIRKTFRRWPQRWRQRLTPADLLTVCIFVLVLNLAIFLL